MGMDCYTEAPATNCRFNQHSLPAVGSYPPDYVEAQSLTGFTAAFIDGCRLMHLWVHPNEHANLPNIDFEAAV